ncbi:nuclear transport factor 2 family protein [Dactylosporangium aurantiacum]|uniref:Nuclear transport factor 2 family protein n=1 Tax=Dactylosporangium aurantiacum TaxID=35754 RepID=A0A9Q9IHS5_9ACTN|nr:nuclear transport factor 2 family protein [Dactylosporangium aurantiacum]MDG6110288.1 nuclear transport factor 2 family protein [Dactylosporangium aurantiacum]UWZ54395.1 nuclear transport factor 2 family protein [Dactylosporangium aurantiacum]
MTGPAALERLQAAERRLQAAQLASDVAVLDELIDERLIFTGPDGRLYGKEDDLRLHRSGAQTMTAVQEEDLRCLVDGRTGVTWFVGRLAGTFNGADFEARMRYTRTWIFDDASGWRLVAGHASVI